MKSFEHIIGNYNTKGISNIELLTAICSLYPALDEVEKTNPKMFWCAVRNFHEAIAGCHFDEMYAKHQVSNMFHVKKTGTICRGEVYSYEVAKKVFEKKVRSLGTDYNCWDVYVAINAQYHDYAKMYKDWGDNITDEELDEKIICSAVNFWFKDDDAEDGKIWNYFKNVK